MAEPPFLQVKVRPVPVAVTLMVETLFASQAAAGGDNDGSRVIAGGEFTVMVPVAVAVPQPPVGVTVYGKLPDTDGVPLMVTTFADHTPVTPVGSPVTVAPVAPVVEKVMLAGSATLRQVVGLFEFNPEVSDIV
jgi:hypothetical protein